MSKIIDFLEEYFQFCEGNKITIISDIRENHSTYTFRYCLFFDYTETGDAEINKGDFNEWLKNNKSSGI